MDRSLVPGDGTDSRTPESTSKHALKATILVLAHSYCTPTANAPSPGHRDAHIPRDEAPIPD